MALDDSQVESSTSSEGSHAELIAEVRLSYHFHSSFDNDPEMNPG